MPVSRHRRSGQHRLDKHRPQGGNHRIVSHRSHSHARGVTTVAGVVILICTAAGAASLGVLEPNVDLSSAALNSARNLKEVGSAADWRTSLQRPAPISGSTDTLAPRKGSTAADRSRNSDAASGVAAPTTVSNLPVPALRAYRSAASGIARTYPSCQLSWHVLAGIGLAESDHGRVGGAVMESDGRSVPRVLGPVLNGRGNVAAVVDTDDGVLDDDVIWDRAVGPMQFIPQTWATVAADGDGDGVRDPDDVDDAALAAAQYLCRYGLDLTDEDSLSAALHSYNDSRKYVLAVLAYADAYRRGVYPTLLAEPQAQVNPAPGRKVTSQPRGDRHPGGPGVRRDPGQGSGNGGGSDPAPQRPKPPQPPKPDPPQPTPDPPAPAPTPEPTPDPPKPNPVTKTVVVTGTLSWCGDGWCVDETYAGLVGGLLGVADHDGDCRLESTWSELNGLAMSGTPVRVTLRQTLVAGQVTATKATAFEIPDPPVCDEAGPVPIPSPTISTP